MEAALETPKTSNLSVGKIITPLAAFIEAEDSTLTLTVKLRPVE